jgi:hypothetical protein
MKKTILLIAAVISLTGSIIAQDGDNDSRGRLMFGLKGGANYSNVYDEQGRPFVLILRLAQLMEFLFQFH